MKSKFLPATLFKNHHVGRLVGLTEGRSVPLCLFCVFQLFECFMFINAPCPNNYDAKYDPVEFEFQRIYRPTNQLIVPNSRFKLRSV